ncbi:hypothetical protein GYMLUDRAFT_48216 [Collybiopsis luxurians FD-317 M1]|uniref:Mitochondrial import inner membrane translocase subunit TIM50 n=1 Tax=Collybiopsis luxurians FD-317 M1 TaxID=944289 RepID=A0A0D0BYU5_9AGAR|nr:hypothetical protein GYMLUDRAFT_48216 [Collybiopsis luxurians FD-317 M1]
MHSKKDTQTPSPSSSNSLDPIYKSVFSSPSSYISKPSTQRKLLVLDLNGTLLFRPHRKSKAKGTTTDGQGQGHRVVHVRPYMPSFKQYLFHERTREWLDTMVWSSAQPHNVGDMVRRAFGSDNGLKAVWARDTLDLDPKFYHKKTVTIKDLSKIWKTFPSHSARTTLLVDDSTQKARLQPWNHIYIKEYGQVERREDMMVKALRKESRGQARAEDPLKSLPAMLSSVDISSSPSSKIPTSASQNAVHAKTSLNPPASSYTTSSGFDSTLLAIIGILDTIKHQDNVSAWLRNGGIVLCGADVEFSTSTGRGGMIGDRWFDTVHIVNWWAEKGRKTLKELGIEEDDGLGGSVERPNGILYRHTHG